MALVLLLAILAQDDRVELRCRFAKGERVTLSCTQAVHVQLQDVPEAFRSVVPAEPFDTTFEGTASFEVTEVDDQGTAKLLGKFHSIRAKGTCLAREFAFSYDRARDGDDLKGEEDESQGFAGLAHPKEMLRQLAVARLTITIDPLGKVTLDGGGKAAALAGQLLDPGGLGGDLPKGKVGAGDGWKSGDELSFTGLPLKLGVRAENSVEKIEPSQGARVAVIRRTFALRADNGSEPPSAMEPRFSGDGRGAAWFDVDAGRPIRHEVALDLAFSMSVRNPQGGEPLAFKGKLALRQGLALGK